MRCDRHRSLHEPSLPESVGKRPDQTRCKQQQTARYARLFNQYSSEKIYVSQNKNLLQLHCYACSLEIERWDLSANPELKDLRIGGDGYVAFDKVSILDCSNNHKLEVLMANLSQMSELYLDCPELQHLSLEGNSFLRSILVIVQNL